jgi:uncharacterized protein HemX
MPDNNEKHHAFRRFSDKLLAAAAGLVLILVAAVWGLTRNEVSTTQNHVERLKEKHEKEFRQLDDKQDQHGERIIRIETFQEQTNKRLEKIDKGQEKTNEKLDDVIRELKK